MIKRKLQIILFSVLLTFSATAQSQTITINNPALRQLAVNFAQAIVNMNGHAQAGALILRSSLKPSESGAALVIDGVAQDINSNVALFSAVLNLALKSGFDPQTLSIVTAASPNT